MLRYVLIGVTLAIAVATVVVFAFGGSPPRPGAIAPVAAVPTVALPIVELPTVAVPTVALPTVAATRPAIMPRADAIDTATGWAGAMGERHPVLIDAILTTLTDANHRLRPPDGSLGDSTETGLPDDAPVWLVQMRGSFVPSSYPAGYVPTPEAGWMYAVTDAREFGVIRWGYVPNGYPIR